jgi:hypothetical protein
MKKKHLERKITRLQQRIQRIGFSCLSAAKQIQLQRKLCSHERQLYQLVGSVALAGLGLGTAQAQTFTEVTTSASPFINLDVDKDRPFGLSTGSDVSFADIDGDDDIDAFTIDRFGRIFFYENISTDLNTPDFLTPLYEEMYPFGLIDEGFGFAIELVDIDHDGDLDAFVGLTTGGVRYYENTSTESSIPAFSLSTDNSPFNLGNVGDRAVPNFVDIDQDGDLDAFIGLGNGKIVYYENISTVIHSPIFSQFTGTAPFGLEDVGDNAAPHLVDIDQDGDLDAFIGEYEGEINYFENISLGTMPEFLLATQNFGLNNVGYNSIPLFMDADADGDLDAFISSPQAGLEYFGNISVDLTVPDFTPPIEDIGYYLSPSCADIDGDGDLDLFVGDKLGIIKYLENTSFATATTPVFDFSYISNPFGVSEVEYSATPSLVDIDSDGDIDLFVGDRYGNITFFENVGNSSDPLFSRTTSSIPFGLKNAQRNASLTFTDIDDDGDYDAFVGNEYGKVDYYENVGSAVSPFFELASAVISFDVGDVMQEATPFFVDIDGDNDLDAFIADAANGTSYFENIGNRSIPVFVSSSANPFQQTYYDRLMPVILDVDNDGLLEAIVGSRFGKIHYFESDIPAPRLVNMNRLIVNTCTQPLSFEFEPLDDAVAYQMEIVLHSMNDQVITRTVPSTVIQLKRTIPRQLVGTQFSMRIAPIFEGNNERTIGRFSASRTYTIGCDEEGITRLEERNEELILDNLISEDETLAIFPIPTRDLLNYNPTQLEGIKAIHLFDLMGRLVKTDRELNGTIDMSDLPSGQYTLVFEGAGRRVHRLVQRM